MGDGDGDGDSDGVGDGVGDGGDVGSVSGNDEVDDNSALMPSDLALDPVAPLQALYLEVVPVIGINQEANLTAVLLPLNPNLTVFYWWIGHSLQVRGPGPLGAPPSGSSLLRWRVRAGHCPRCWQDTGPALWRGGRRSPPSPPTPSICSGSRCAQAWWTWDEPGQT